MFASATPNADDRAEVDGVLLLLVVEVEAEEDEDDEKVEVVDAESDSRLRRSGLPVAAETAPPESLASASFAKQATLRGAV
jgi:hypothetical protein